VRERTLRARFIAKASPSRGVLLAVVAAFALAMPASAPAAHAPKTPIKHLVLLMQANHSFDNYFGTYPGADGFPRGTCQPISLGASGGDCVAPYHLGDVTVPDLDHPLAIFRRQHRGGHMDGFVASYRQLGAGLHKSVMGYYDKRDIPFAWSVAQRYVLFDRFFSSASAGTLANHMYWVAGTRGTNDEDQIPAGGFSMPTIFDRLQQAGVSWKFYVENYDPGVTYRHPGRGPRRQQPKTVPLLAFNRFIDDKRLNSHIVDLDRYFDDVRDGTLPAVSYIVTSASSERPPGSVQAGQQLIRTLVTTLIASRAWRSSAFMWAYDDWGGWFDHVPPPRPDSHGYGFRVPALLLSPYAKRGVVDHSILDFTSMLRFIEDNWSLEPLARRDARAHSIAAAFDFGAKPRQAELLPAPGAKPPRELKGRGVVYFFYFGALALVAIILLAGIRGERRRRTAGLAAVAILGVLLISVASAHASTTVQAIPAIHGLRFTYNGEALRTDANGQIVVPTDDRATLRATLHAQNTTVRHAVHAHFHGWRHGRASWTLMYQVRPAFVDADGDHVNPARIASIALKGPAGTRLRLRADRATWIPGNRIVTLGRRPVSRPIAWAVESVIARGANVVSRSQQRFIPARARHPRVRVRFYRLRFAASDALLRRAIGSEIALRYPDGHTETHRLGHDGQISLGSLPGGSYHVTLKAPGLAAQWPIALSRDQDLDVQVISYLDIVLGLGALGLGALALLLAGRPRLRARLRRMPA
jgi:phospholipase C